MTGYIYRDILRQAFDEKKMIVIHVDGERSFRGKLIKNTAEGGVLRREPADLSSRIEHFEFALDDIQALTLLQ